MILITTISTDELAGHAGDGSVYVAVKGNVYDVSDSPLWEGGEHFRVSTSSTPPVLISPENWTTRRTTWKPWKTTP